MTTILNGLLGGAVVAVVTAVAARAVAGERTETAGGSRSGTGATAPRWRTRLYPIA